MASQVEGVAEDQVAHGAALNADLFLLDKFLQVGMEGQVETVADALGAQEDRIVKILIGRVYTFTGVEDQGQWGVTCFFKDEGEEVF
jgi:hypothetical protein